MRTEQRITAIRLLQLMKEEPQFAKRIGLNDRKQKKKDKDDKKH